MQLLTVTDVQQRLNVSRACVYSLIAEGKLPCVRIGVGRGTIRVDEAELEAFVEKCRTVPTPSRKPSQGHDEFRHLNVQRLRNAWQTDVERGKD